MSFFYLFGEILSSTQYQNTRPGDNEKDRDRQVYRVFPLEFRVRPPGSVEGFIGEVSVNELLECDLVAGWRLQAQPQQEVRTLIRDTLCYGFQGAPEM